MALIRGNRFDNTLYAEAGDKVNAFAGDDEVSVAAGDPSVLRDTTILLGRGNDTVTGGQDQTGHIWAGVGNDAVYWFGSGQIVGGKGDDLLIAMDNSALYGDEGPGLAPSAAGNDIMLSQATPAGGVSTQTGGNGFDWHVFNAQFDGLGGASACVVTDFQAGQDKVAMTLSYGLPAGGGYLNSAQIWSVLDTNADGVLNGTDVPWDANSGTAVVDGSLHLRLHDDTLVIAHTTAITTADWLFT